MPSHDRGGYARKHDAHAWLPGLFWRIEASITPSDSFVGAHSPSEKEPAGYLGFAAVRFRARRYTRTSSFRGLTT
jgi:hypothetical protein